MNTPNGSVKARLLRKHILQLARELYLHPHSGISMAENLKAHFHDLNAEAVSGHFLYLADTGLLLLRKNRQGMSVQITPKGIDVLDGAVAVRGVEPGDPQLARLSYKKELRRGILHYCYSFRDSFNEDAEMQAEFRTAGFSNLLIEEVRFHMWYLRHKDYLCLQTPSIGGDMVFMAKITPAGVDVVEQAKKDPGITHDAD